MNGSLPLKPDGSITPYNFQDSPENLRLCKAFIRETILTLRSPGFRTLQSQPGRTSLPGLSSFGRPHPLVRPSPVATAEITSLWFHRYKYARTRHDRARRRALRLPATDTLAQ